jgi:hypothetical protein
MLAFSRLMMVDDKELVLWHHGALPLRPLHFIMGNVTAHCLEFKFSMNWSMPIAKKYDHISLR